MLTTRELRFQYSLEKQFRFPDIHLEEKQDCLIYGPSGVGKTTMLLLLAGLLSPGEGEIVLDGTRINQLKGAQLDRFRGSHIGLVFQQPHFIRSLTLGQNMRLIQRLAGRKPDPSNIFRTLEELDIAHHMHAHPYRLSQGERQRAGIAMAVLNEPALILADEPTSNLDDTNCDRVIDLLKVHAHVHGAHLVVISHDNRIKSHFTNSLGL